MNKDFGRCLSGPRSRPTGRATLRRLVGIAASIAIAGCSQTEQEQQQQQQAQLRAEMQRSQRLMYRECLYDATGPFGSASIEVVRDCRDRVYGSASGTLLREDPKGLRPKASGPSREAGVSG